MQNPSYLVVIGSLLCSIGCAATESPVSDNHSLHTAMMKFIRSLDGHITEKSPISLTGNDTSVEKKIARETAKKVRLEVYNKYQNYKRHEKNFAALAAHIQQTYKSIENQRKIAGVSDVRDERLDIWKDMRTGLDRLKRTLNTEKQ